VADAYELADISPASDGFWSKLDEIEISLEAALAHRPMGDIEITQACNAAMKAFSSSVTKERRDQQARAAAAESGS